MRSQSACSLGYGWESGRPHGWPACTSSGQKLRPSLVGFLAAWLADWGLSYSLVVSPTRAQPVRGLAEGREVITGARISPLGTPIWFAVMEQQADQPLECKNGWTLADLGPGQCRFIIDNERSPAIFCGDPVVPSTSWCVKHRKRVFAHPAGLATVAEKRLSGRL